MIYVWRRVAWESGIYHMVSVRGGEWSWIVTPEGAGPDARMWFDLDWLGLRYVRN